MHEYTTNEEKDVLLKDIDITKLTDRDSEVVVTWQENAPIDKNYNMAKTIIDNLYKK